MGRGGGCELKCEVGVGVGVVVVEFVVVIKGYCS